MNERGKETRKELSANLQDDLDASEEKKERKTKLPILIALIPLANNGPTNIHSFLPSKQLATDQGKSLSPEIRVWLT